MLCAVWCLLYDVCCLLCVGCCCVLCWLLVAVCDYSLFVLRCCVLCVVCCLWFGVRGLMCGVRRVWLVVFCVLCVSVLLVLCSV